MGLGSPIFGADQCQWKSAKGDITDHQTCQSAASTFVGLDNRYAPYRVTHSDFMEFIDF